jgi:hypothetical protein
MNPVLNLNLEVVKLVTQLVGKSHAVTESVYSSPSSQKPVVGLYGETFPKTYFNIIIIGAGV